MLYFIIFIIFAALAVKAFFCRLPDVAEAKKGGAGLTGCFLGMAAVLYQWLPQKRGKKTGILKNLAELYPEEIPGRIKRQYDIQRIKIMLMVIFAGDIVALFMWISGGKEEVLVDGGYVLRNRQGEGSREVLLTARRENGEGIESGLVIKECRYETKELEELYEEMLQKIPSVVLADNESWDCVTKDLCFMDRMEGYPFSLQWSSDNYYFLTGSGKVAAFEDVKEKKEKTALVTLTLRAEYYDFAKEQVFYARICPMQEETAFSDKVKDSLKQSEEENPYDSKVLLPATIQGEQVVWEERQDSGSGQVFFLSILGAAAVCFLKNLDLQKKVQERNAKLAAEYPAVITRLALYLGAGMNLNGAWEKTAAAGSSRETVNPVYREMLLTCHEIEGGISEAEGYERFGRRVRQQRYIRLTTLLVQNLKKGNAALLLQLRQEAFLALEEYDAEIKRAGEETGTKLLFPMMLLMGMVMVLIMVPAFFSI